MTNIVEVTGLTKSFGKVTEVDHVSFKVEANKILKISVCL